jgi:hypothetical protein
MSEQSRENRESAEAPNVTSDIDQENYGSLSVEDDPAGTVNPADLAGTAQPDDAEVTYRPSASKADQDEP